MKAPIYEKKCTKIKFGFVEGEVRGIDELNLINPPIELDDEYFWIRDNSRSDVKIINHINKENEYTDWVMNPHKEFKKSIYKEIKSYIKESYDTFAYQMNEKASWKYFKRYWEGKSYPGHYRKKISKDGLCIEEELLDINMLAEGKLQCNVTSFSVSPNHKMIAYGIDWDGSEEYNFILVNLVTKQEIPTSIPKLAYCNYLFASDNLLYYLLGDSANRLHQLWLYNIKTGITQLIFEEFNPDYDLNVMLSNDEKFVILSSGNYDSNLCKIIDWETNPLDIIDFLPLINQIQYSIEHHDVYWYVHTNLNAINWKIMRIKESEKINWENLEEFIFLNDLIYISSFTPYKNFLSFKTEINGNTYLNLIDPDKITIKVLTHLENKIYSWNEYIEQDFTNLKSEHVYTITDGINRIYSTDKFNVKFSSMISPIKFFDYNIKTLDYVQVYEDYIPNYNENLYESKRIWVKQSGTRLGIPVSIVYRKDYYKKDGTNPLCLYGYGSYGITIKPYFDYKILPLLDRGYLYGIVHVRGGSFLGYNWYLDGKMYKKLNTFKDFIKCAEFFGQNGYCNPNKIVIEGRSAGGLLIGTVITMRPDLFWIAIPIVPFVDVLNTISDSIIPLTKEEWTQWGNPNELESFQYIKHYCPYTNVKANFYPHMYCTAGLHDPRVPYWEIIKFIARIREHKKDLNYQVIRVETQQGHFGGSSRYKLIEELAEKYAFIFTREEKTNN